MAFTYDGDIGNSTRDLVRFLIGDVDYDDPLLQDGEVDAAIAREATANLAAAFLCDGLAARFSRHEQVSGDGISIGSGLANRYRNLASDLRARAADAPIPDVAASGAGSVVVTGLTRDDIRENEQDTTYPGAPFRRVDDTDPDPVDPDRVSPVQHFPWTAY